ncbi:Mor transcription activator family protein [Levilactobacillus acidifarinae]|uniref:Mor transcription activator domain-containing protein n=1 Tax=Levilactobacillus acidifarinae DSM 19394 = JCM 15949 TaxID=1423715 RepID=A0A0R1LJG0_9LACO|nr:Mor transcription activator family protein [Levilactobacillus acidifarinae]KRK95935.1 hypothetical protein FD25_GL002396 [Levilactobacillus acidifarinae DSM 19394]GEO69239.1 hypothetical protein LAC03_11490 [Levilactobacillus acidifarinae]
MDNPMNWHPLYRELATIIGITNTQRLHQVFGGSQINLPKRLLDPHKEANLIFKEYQTGQTVHQLAYTHQYSERNIRRILAHFKE